MPETRRNLSDRIREARRQLGLTQYSLASRASMTRAAIQKAENGHVKFPKNLEQIARALGVSLGWLAFGHEQQPRTPLSPAELAVATSWERIPEGQRVVLRVLLDQLQRAETTFEIRL